MADFSVGQVNARSLRAHALVEPARTLDEAIVAAAGIYGTLHSGLIDRGVSFAPSAYEVIFVSLAHDETVIDETVEAFTSVLGEFS